MMPSRSEGPLLAWQEDVRAAQRGERAAFERLVRSAQRSVYGLSRRLLGNDAEAAEVTQEAFLRAYQHLERYDETHPFEVWLLAIARNLCLDLLRRRARQGGASHEPLSEKWAGTGPSLEEQVAQGQVQDQLQGALQKLSTSDQEVLSLYYVQRKTTKEIAHILSVAPGTIMARLFRAREKLRQLLGPEEK